jgi:hypothetical protein
MPENTIKVDRTSPYGNPFVVGKHGTVAECVRLFKHMLSGAICLSTGNVEQQQKCVAAIKRDREKNRGKNVACWCRKEAECHGDVLLAIFNAEPGTTPKVEL